MVLYQLNSPKIRIMRPILPRNFFLPHLPLRNVLLSKKSKVSTPNSGMPGTIILSSPGLSPLTHKLPGNRQGVEGIDISNFGRETIEENKLERDSCEVPAF